MNNEVFVNGGFELELITCLNEINKTLKTIQQELKELKEKQSNKKKNLLLQVCKQRS